MADERPIGYWLKLVDGLIENRFAELIEEHGVTRRQWMLLGVLQREPATAAELDEQLAPFLSDAGSADAEDGLRGSAAHLAELVESEWIVVDATSRYTLTERGRVAHSGLGERVEALRAGMAEGVDEADYATTTATLEQLARNLGWNG